LGVGFLEPAEAAPARAPAAIRRNRGQQRLPDANHAPAHHLRQGTRPDRAEQRELVHRQSAREQRSTCPERLQPAFGCERNPSLLDPRERVGLPRLAALLIGLAIGPVRAA
jgi:hypothetical protein